MRQLFEELKRRHAFRVAVVYAVVAWVVIQVANVVLPRLELPGRTARTTVRLPPGAYWMECYVTTPEGHTAHFTVTLDPGQYAWVVEAPTERSVVRTFTVE